MFSVVIVAHRADKDRERLIVEEKELAKLKEENRQVSHPQEYGQ